jgi:hypothetical protein
MINPYQQRVHQKMAHSRILMSLVADCDDTIPGKQKMEALLQSVIIHLNCAYHVYLKEIAFDCGIQAIEGINSIEKIREQLDLQEKSNASVTELLNLKSSGWLGSFHGAVEQILYPSAYAQYESSLIAVAGSDSSVVINLQAVTDFLQKFNNIFERQRHSNVEY